MLIGDNPLIVMVLEFASVSKLILSLLSFLKLAQMLDMLGTVLAAIRV